MQAVEKPSGSNKFNLVQVPRHHGTPGDEEAYKLAKEWTNEVPSDQTVGIAFVVGKEAIRSQLRRAPEQEENL